MTIHPQGAEVRFSPRAPKGGTPTTCSSLRALSLFFSLILFVASARRGFDVRGRPHVERFERESNLGIQIEGLGRRHRHIAKLEAVPERNAWRSNACSYHA